MTDTQINIAIAEACGIADADQCGPLYKTATGWVRDCPDYVNDLNAMHEAEKVLLKDGCDSELYLDYLMQVVVSAPSGLSNHATASQRAKAFLRTLGKWEEVQP